MRISYDGLRRRAYQAAGLHPELDLDHWTPIEWWPKGWAMGVRWRPVEGAPLTKQRAEELVASGVLLKATRVTDEGTFMVVKLATSALRIPQIAA